MYISQQLKDKNIAEYLLYMWQVEDLIRANDLDTDKIRLNLIDRYQVSEEEKNNLTEWYGNLIRMMYEEGVQVKGHLQINKNIIIQLTELHAGLSRSPGFPFYHAAYYKALPFIVELRARKDSQNESELETALEALYGIMMLRIQQKPISEETTKAIGAISSFISLLANYYQKQKNGELKLDE